MCDVFIIMGSLICDMNNKCQEELTMARKADVDKKVCVACGVCVKACPRQAIYIHKGCYAVVKEELCVGCGICGKNCPAGCIKLSEV